jgi:alkylation response protein AidB-like acyl-CoA dehydrogenase
MQIAYTPEHESLRQELREYYAKLLTPEVRTKLSNSHGIGPDQRAVVKQMGGDGLLGQGWPKEYGGKGLGPLEQFVFFDESMRAGAPVPMLTINTVGPTIMNYGTDAQKDYFLPKILAGEVHFCIGYSEPGAGSDLAALDTRAVRDGDEYIVNGTKIWTSLASDADWCWLAVRTNPEAKKHKGISMLLVDMKNTPGITVQPLDLLPGHDIAQVFFEDVRVPAENLVGEENGGWRLITNQLNHERVTLCSSGMIEKYVNDVHRWAQETLLDDGRRVIDQEWVQVSLARVYSRLEFLRLINWKIAWAAQQDSLHPADASATKAFGTEFFLEALRGCQEIVGQAGYLPSGSPGAALAGQLEQAMRGLLILTYGGGTNELQRDIIAMFGLGMPRADR